MITGEQVFKNNGKPDLKVIHAPKQLNAEYFLTLVQGVSTVTLDLYDLKRINRVANKNQKELLEKSGP